MKCNELEPKEFPDGVTKYYFQSEVDEAIAELKNVIRKHEVNFCPMCGRKFGKD